MTKFKKFNRPKPIEPGHPPKTKIVKRKVELEALKTGCLNNYYENCKTTRNEYDEDYYDYDLNILLQKINNLPRNANVVLRVSLGGPSYDGDIFENLYLYYEEEVENPDYKDEIKDYQENIKYYEKDLIAYNTALLKFKKEEQLRLQKELEELVNSSASKEKQLREALKDLNNDEGD